MEVSVISKRGPLLLFSLKGLGTIYLNQKDRKSNKHASQILSKSLSFKFTNFITNFMVFDLKSNQGEFPIIVNNNRNNYINL